MHKSTKKLLTETLLTTRELSAYTGIKAATIKKWVERGKVDYVLKGKTYLFDRRDFRPLPGWARFLVSDSGSREDSMFDDPQHQ